MLVRGFEYYAATGAPVVGATVEVWNAQFGVPAGSPLATTTTDANGMWAFADLADTMKDVKVTLGGRVRWYKGLTKHSMASLLLGDGLYAPGVGNNLLVNPGFEVWQRGNGPFTTGGTSADRWWTDIGVGSSYSLLRDGSNVATNSRYAAAFSHTYGVDPSAFYQVAEGLQQAARNSILTGSIAVKCSVAAAVRPFIDGGFGGRHYGSYHTGDGTYQVLSATTNGGVDGGTPIRFGVYVEKSCTAYLDNAVLRFGDVAGPYEPLPLADDLARCERYYERQSGYQVISGYALTNMALLASFTFRAKKAISPSVTVAGTWTSLNIPSAPGGAPSVFGSSPDGYALFVTASANGLASIYSNADGQYVEAVAEP